jgi:photosystem II stability/assembly factor-like uncharacterized protein
MAAGADRLLYLGSQNGLFVAEPDGDRYEVRPLGLSDMGQIYPLVDHQRPGRLYAGTAKRGMYRSEDGGQNWCEINEGIVYKKIFSLAQHPQTGTLYVGTEPSSVFRSTDGGDTWEAAEQLWSLPTTIDWTFPHPPHISHVRDIQFSPADPAVVFGAVEEGWLIRSKDGGETWENLKDGVNSDGHAVAIMPDNPAVVWATTGYGLFRSVDGGDHFTEWTTGPDRQYLTEMVVHPARPKILFTAAAAVIPPEWSRPAGADSAFYRSEDQGASWHRLSDGLPEHLTAGARCTVGDPAEPETVFFGLSDGSVWMTEDDGESCRQIVGGLPQIRSIRVARR